jgi:K+-sensing histidine kinase KdpD
LDERNRRFDAAADGDVIVTEYRARHKNGEWRWLYSRDVVLTRRPDQRAARILGVSIDITERRQAEERARLLQELTSLLAQAMTPQAVAETVVERVLRSLGGHLGSIGLISERGDSLEIINTVGLPEEIVRDFKNTPLDYPLPLTDAARLGIPVTVETVEDYTRRYPNFASTLLNVTHSHATIALPLHDHERVIGAMGVSFMENQAFSPEDLAFYQAVAQQCAQAVVRARLYAAEQRARRQAEQADQLKLKFLAMVSHELRTPLTSVKGFATTLLADDIQFTTDQQRQFLEIISQESDRLTELVEQLLNVTQLQAGNLLIVPYCQAFEAVLDAAAAQLEVLTRAHHLVITCEPHLPLVLVDSRRIAQVLVNLVGNAVKFSPADTMVRVQAMQAENGIRVEVSDEGPGIPDEVRPHIFEPFRQGENSVWLHHGVGLGLAICKGLIESHGGRIWIVPHNSRGATIAFWLPAAPDAACAE